MKNRGGARQVIVEIGKPVPVSLQGAHLADAGEGDHFRCPLSITGLGLDSRVFPISGVLAAIALTRQQEGHRLAHRPHRQR